MMMATATVKTRPIMFKGPMVRAIIDGVKTQTRRLCKDQDNVEWFRWVENSEVWPERWKGKRGEPYTGWVVKYANLGGLLLPRSCAYGVTGDHLYVRETVRLVGRRHRGTERRRVIYPATCAPGTVRPPLTPAMLMPRWASRLTLEVVRVRVEKLHEISEADARAEGIREVTKDGAIKKYCVYDQGDMSSVPWAEMPRTAVDVYRALWESINGEGSWAKNPWVWVVEFKRIEAGD